MDTSFIQGFGYFQQKAILLVELTVPWEENMEWAHERKLLRYEQLARDCKSEGWRCVVFAD